MNYKERGFTIVEIIIVIAILAFLSAITLPDFASIFKKNDLESETQKFISALDLAQSKTMSSEGFSQYGIYLDTVVSPNKYILFKGATYESRDNTKDLVYFLKNSFEFYNINLGGGSEVVFKKLSGTTDQSGIISIKNKNDSRYSRAVYISNSGAIGLNQPAVVSDDDRTKDSRHVELSYSRYINLVGGENLVLTFNNSTTQTVPINTYLEAGELSWQGTVNVGGINQTVEIITHRLNNPDTLFSIRRDRRYNNTSLRITISGDTSGSIVEYSSDGSIVTSSSIYVSGLVKK